VVGGKGARRRGSSVREVRDEFSGATQLAHTESKNGTEKSNFVIGDRGGEVKVGKRPEKVEEKKQGTYQGGKTLSLILPWPTDLEGAMDGLETREGKKGLIVVLNWDRVGGGVPKAK